MGNVNGTECVANVSTKPAYCCTDSTDLVLDEPPCCCTGWELGINIEALTWIVFMFVGAMVSLIVHGRMSKRESRKVDETLAEFAAMRTFREVELQIESKVREQLSPNQEVDTLGNLMTPKQRRKPYGGRVARHGNTQQKATHTPLTADFFDEPASTPSPKRVSTRHPSHGNTAGAKTHSNPNSNSHSNSNANTHPKSYRSPFHNFDNTKQQQTPSPELAFGKMTMDGRSLSAFSNSSSNSNGTGNGTGMDIHIDLGLGLGLGIGKKSSKKSRNKQRNASIHALRRLHTTMSTLQRIKRSATQARARVRVKSELEGEFANAHAHAHANGGAGSGENWNGNDLVVSDEEGHRPPTPLTRTTKATGGTKNLKQSETQSELQSQPQSQSQSQSHSQSQSPRNGMSFVEFHRSMSAEGLDDANWDEELDRQQQQQQQQSNANANAHANANANANGSVVAERRWNGAQSGTGGEDFPDPISSEGEGAWRMQTNPMPMSNANPSKYVQMQMPMRVLTTMPIPICVHRLQVPHLKMCPTSPLPKSGQPPVR